MKVLITGGSSSIAHHLKTYFPDAIYTNSSNLNLIHLNNVVKYIQKLKPDVVVHCAARVGGILDNISTPHEFLDNNLMINTNLTYACKEAGVNRFIGLLSTCIYGDNYMDSEYPLREEQVFDGNPALSNFSYAYAKRCLGLQIQNYRKLGLLNYCYIIPSNLYSEFDTHQGKSAHFVTACIAKCREALNDGKNTINLMGSGKPLRQFMYAKDVARLIEIMITTGKYENVNVASNENLSIKVMAEIICSKISKGLKINWDLSKPDGQFRKDVSVSKLVSIYPELKITNFKDGMDLII
ncbi:NAD-dependent epimerase/dehydratase family protein [bacterium]|nr:NAD-dependent epimerase/dehydratase family protein [bacterium]MDA7660298.1 NAD-dependent epimerase/dehydratase family protein [Verrucomicrobiota bacterium]